MMLSATRLSATGWNYGANPPPVISGFAYPLETLTSTRAGQWAIDGVPVSGQTGSTFQVPLLAYGRSITCGGSAPVTVWKPWDIPGVVSVRVADRGVLNAVSPDVAATNGQTVRRWNGLVSNFQANQATSVAQPVFRSSGQSGNPSVEFDGANHRMVVTDSAERDFARNVSSAYCIIGFRDTLPTSGAARHVLFWSEEFQVTTRDVFSGGGLFVAVGRNVSGTSLVVSLGSNNSNYNVITAESLYSSGVFNGRLNGTQIGSSSYASGVSRNVAGFNIIVGAQDDAPSFNIFPGHICCLIMVNQILSATNRSRLERFAGLFGSLNIPLV
jgi:hypothetical protein